MLDIGPFVLQSGLIKLLLCYQIHLFLSLSSSMMPFPSIFAFIKHLFVCKTLAIKNGPVEIKPNWIPSVYIAQTEFTPNQIP